MQQTKRYKMIISDFDGTLRDDNYRVSEKTAEAIRRHTQNGGIFAVVTGRMRSSILPIVRSIPLTGLVVSYQGATVTEIETGKDLLNAGLRNEQAIFVCGAFARRNLHTHVYIHDTLYCNVDDEALHLYEKYCKIKGIVEPDLQKLIAEDGGYVQKILAMVDPADRDGIIDDLREELGSEYDVTYSSDFFVEVSAKDYTKGTIVPFLARFYGIEESDILAVGDSFNDAPMLIRAGMGVAVANADKRLKEIADVIYTYTNNEDAVRRILEEYGLAKE